ncbi:MAG: hypothetical protein KKC20_10150 [Proteobacteria bacterium]|nr:hypothetical protein [Pseudomonadota bacterium]
MQDIHPITAPVMVGLDPAQVRLMLFVVGGLALLALVIFLIQRFQKSRTKKQIQELFPVMGPYDAALGELDHLCREPIIDPKAFYFDLGAIVKRYIGGSYAMNAVEMTTQELVKQIRHTGMDMALILEVSKFLTVSDPFRYGPVVPDPCLAERDLACVRQMIVGMEQDLESRRAPSTDGKEETA